MSWQTIAQNKIHIRANRLKPHAKQSYTDALASRIHQKVDIEPWETGQLIQMISVLSHGDVQSIGLYIFGDQTKYHIYVITAAHAHNLTTSESQSGKSQHVESCGGASF